MRLRRIGKRVTIASFLLGLLLVAGIAYAAWTASGCN